MKLHRKYKPYVRLANGNEQSESLRVAMRLAFYQLKRRPFYVMVQRGYPDLAMDCGATKREVQRSPLLVSRLGYSFRKWANDIQRRASGRK